MRQLGDDPTILAAGMNAVGLRASGRGRFEENLKAHRVLPILSFEFKTQNSQFRPAYTSSACPAIRSQLKAASTAARPLRPIHRQRLWSASKVPSPQAT